MGILITQGKRERINFQGAIFHITTRCNNRLSRFTSHEPRIKYLEILKKCKNKFGFKLFNYAIMHTHVHLLIKLDETIDISKIMHSINRRYAAWYNRNYYLSGHFWEERFYATLLKNDLQLLTNLIYIDANPVKAKYCEHPEGWDYSGAKMYISGENNPLLDSPTVYKELGETIHIRQNTYKHMLELYISQFMNKHS